MSRLPLLAAIFSALIWITPSSASAQSILTFPNAEGKFGYVGGSSPQPFDTTTALNPTVGYDWGTANLSAWSTPAFYGGYRLTTINNTNGSYGPNFVKTVESPPGTPGYVSLPVTEIFHSGTTGTITNTVDGTFVTPTSITGDGQFTVSLQGTSLLGATAEFRGVVYDGMHWLVTADAATVLSEGALSATISTAGGWHVLDTSDFSFTTGSDLISGPITYSGLWFRATETSPLGEQGFNFTFGNVTFAAVPEPTTAAAFAGVAALGVAMLRRRKRA